MCQTFLNDKVPEYIRDAGNYILSESGVQKVDIQEGEVWEVRGNIQGDDFQVYTPKLTFSYKAHKTIIIGGFSHFICHYHYTCPAICIKHQISGKTCCIPCMTDEGYSVSL